MSIWPTSNQVLNSVWPKRYLLSFSFYLSLLLVNTLRLNCKFSHQGQKLMSSFSDEKPLMKNISYSRHQ